VRGIVPVSASVGVGRVSDGAQFADAFVEADRAVYEDKQRRGVARR
jgi:hypothetical protein